MTEQQFKELNTLLKQGILLLESLVTLYDTELDALSSQNLEKLSDCTQDKMDLLNKFHSFTQERVTLLSSFGFEVAAGDYKHPAEDNIPSAVRQKIDQLNDSIKQHLKTLQVLNKRNEQAIYRNQQNVGQLLDIVRGHTGNDQLYGKSGSAGLYKAQSRLGKA